MGRELSSTQFTKAKKVNELKLLFGGIFEAFWVFLWQNKGNRIQNRRKTKALL
jgi:hypothetical protein